MAGHTHARLQLRVLGGFELRRDGQTVCHWPRAGPRQLLKRLAVSERQAISADALAESFWPDDGSDKVVQRLHNLVYLLRKTLQPGIPDSQPDNALQRCLRTDGGLVRLVTGETLWIDLVEFEQQLAAARLSNEDEGPFEQALTLYRGRLLRDDADEDWLAPRRVQVEGRFVAAAHRLAMLQVQQGRLQAATETLNKLLAEAPSDEPAHRELITLYGRLGRAEDVQRQFNECTAIVQRELDAEPDAETCSAYQAAQETAQVSSAAARPGRAAGSRPASPDQVEAPIQTRWTAPHPVGQLLGRDEAVGSAVKQLRDGVRLLSLVGTGGIGKTQLAIRIAHEAQQTYPQGACFVPLAEAQPGDLYPAMARALGLKLSRHEEPKVTVQRVLERSPMLLVIDNFEHMLSEAAELGLLLQHCARLALLVTSRMRLNLVVETCVTVPPLAVDREGSELPEALRLFVDCARRIRPELALHAGETEDAVAITKCLGGLPLAIELAAARLPLFSLRELRRAVEASFHVLTGGGADRPPRQRSLRQSFGWSYALLSPNEQSLLLLLGLCDASFDHHDAQGLAGTNVADPEIELQTLVELGFVTRARTQAREPDATDESSFEIAPALREFMRQEMRRHAERTALQLRFIDHFVKRADEIDAASEAGDPEQVRRALSEFATQSPNFFAALNVADSAGQPLDVCRLVAALAQLWGFSGMWHEPNRWIDRAGKHAEVLGLEHRGRLMYGIGIYWERHGLVAQALVAAKQAVRFAEEADQPSVLAPALMLTYLLLARDTQVPLTQLCGLLRRARQIVARMRNARLKLEIASDQAMMHLAQGNLRRALVTLAACDRQLERAGDEFARARINFDLAKVFCYNGRPQTALASLEKTLTRVRGTAPSVLAEVYSWAGWFHCCHIDIARARDMVRLTEETLVNVGSDYLRFAVSLLEGRIALLAEEWPKALELLSAAVLAESRDAGPWVALDAQLWCFQAAMHTGADDIAAKALSCALSSRVRWAREQPRMLEAASAWLVHHGCDDAAALAWLQAHAIRTKKGIVRFPVDQAMSEQTCTTLAHSLGPGWQSEWQTKMPAIDGDDPLAWLIDVLSASSMSSPRRSPAAVKEGHAKMKRRERAPAERAVGSGR